MKDSFPGFRQPTPSEFDTLWNDGLFVLDANVLLNLYRFPTTASQELLNALSGLSDRLWIPFHVGLEFQRNRPIVIAEQKRKFHQVRQEVNPVVSGLEGKLNSLQLKKRHSSIDPDTLVNNLRAVVDSFMKQLDELEKGQLDVVSEDQIADKIDQLFHDNVGPRPRNQDELEKIYKEGNIRYERNVPPGYMDDYKGTDEDGAYSYGGLHYLSKFGDLILWKQLLNKVKEDGIKYVVFLTDDDKEDWWWIIDSGGKKTLGPRPELVEEIRRESGALLFHSYNSEQFLRFAKERLKADVSDDSITQVRDVTTSTQSRMVSDLTRRGTEAEFAVLNWLVSTYGVDEVIHNQRGFPDFTVSSAESNEITGYEVLLLRDALLSWHRLRDRFYRAYHAVHQEGYDSFNFVIVLQDPETYPRVLTLWQRDESMRNNVGHFGLVIGKIEPDNTSELGVRFEVIHSELDRDNWG